MINNVKYLFFYILVNCCPSLTACVTIFGQQQDMTGQAVYGGSGGNGGQAGPATLATVCRLAAIQLGHVPIKI